MSFHEEFKQAVDNSKGKGDIADAVGMPDEHDYEVLLGIIKTFERKHPGFLKQHMESVHKEFQKSRYADNKHSLVNKDSGMRYAVELPEELYLAIQAIFPSIWRSKKHLRWFASKFPGLTVAGTPL